VQNAKLRKPSRCGGTDSRYVFYDTFMDKSYDIRRIGGDKIALLALFALSLLTARVVVGLKSTIVLSDPIPLRGTGISVAVPVGNGWQSMGQWGGDGNTFILQSSFSAGPGRPTAAVVCKYQPAIGVSTPSMLFEQRAAELNGMITPIDQIMTDSLIFDCARIDSEESPITAFIGRAVIAEDQQLVIEVREITGDIELAEATFRRVVESMIYRGSLPRTALSKT